MIFGKHTTSLVVLTAVFTTTAYAANDQAFTFETASGETIEAFRGAFTVPENRAHPNGRQLEVHYVRFPATGTQPGAPIIYLSGGPGGSGIETAKHERFPLFMAMREFGDVIALDQRGAGASADAPNCVSDTIIPMDRHVSRTERNALLRQAVESCGAFWRKAGFDPAGYTTIQSTQDLDALRAHLGAPKISLWGISYGTHLALAAIKEIGPRLDKVVLSSVEGLDQTVKLPSETDAYFDRLQAAINQEPAARAAYPDIKALIRRVHAKLDSETTLITVSTPTGPKPMLLTTETMQMLASGMIADPKNASNLLMLYLAVDNGITQHVADILGRFVTPGEPEEFTLMSLAMDIASGIDAKRLSRVETEAQTALLGDMLNYPMPQVAGALGLDLGEGFRTAPQSTIPTLVLTGTLDGRTYPAEQAAAVAGLVNAQTVTVENAGHNLFMVSPEVTEVIRDFMRGETVHTHTIKVTLPSFAPPF
ncbi:hypothetical protein MMA231_03712 (plasmid) [Asticcacaulis sp. MM231]|uniref:alpha/beta fold hydrolase n=1 Tax=Asticcacaulis sp. MM231 TaxID=3157666 RepID=UPI0032D56D19